MIDMATEQRRRSVPLEESQLPRAVDAETALLDAACYTPQARELLLSLPTGAITIPAYQAIVAVMRQMQADGVMGDRIAILEAAAALGHDRDAIFETLQDVADTSPADAMAEQHAKIVRSRYEERLAIQRVHASLQLMLAKPAESRYVLRDLVATVTDFAGAESDGFVPMGLAIAEAFDDAERRAKGDRTAFIRTGIAALDEDPVGGLEAGDLMTWMMVSGHGKTAALVLIALRAALEGTGVGIVSAEMIRRQIGRRMVSNLTGIPFAKLKSWQLHSDDIARAVYAKHLIDQLPIWIDHQGTPKLGHVVTQVRRLKQRHPEMKLVLVDYATLIEGTGGTAAEAHGQVIKALKRLAKELEIAIGVLVQPDAKTVERRKDDEQMPELADIAWCQEFRNQSDIVISGYRPGEVQHQRTGVRQADHDALFMQRKGRNSGGGRWRWSWDGPTMGFDGGCWGWFKHQYNNHRDGMEGAR
jgi:replicative DNA helicase